MSRKINFPKKKYNIIYADPPWLFKTFSDKGKTKSADNHYACQGLDWIKGLPVSDITEDNSILFMWVTFPILQEAFSVIESWGFTYSTCGFVWVKTNRKYNVNQTSFLPYQSLDSFWGLGYWTRSNAELCLIAKKGKISRLSNSVHQLIYEPIREHSRKPDIVRDKIVELCGNIPRIELFARTKIDGWDYWGNETEKYTKKTSEKI
tara:strand:- start:5276 stop:5893 length:618 start_codon:yes stop_codon:yes gene_type:complete